VTKCARANSIAAVEDGQPRDGAGFECSLARSGDTVVARLRGELDLAAARSLEQTLQTVIAERPRRVIVDLRRLEFMGSTGLHAFSKLRRRLDPDAELLLVRGPEGVHRVFVISGLAEKLHFVDAADVAAELAGLP
jgi:anti-sigma B factor antagonist